MPACNCFKCCRKSNNLVQDPHLCQVTIPTSASHPKEFFKCTQHIYVAVIEMAYYKYQLSFTNLFHHITLELHFKEISKKYSVYSYIHETEISSESCHIKWQHCL